MKNLNKFKKPQQASTIYLINKMKKKTKKSAYFKSFNLRLLTYGCWLLTMKRGE